MTDTSNDKKEENLKQNSDELESEIEQQPQTTEKPKRKTQGQMIQEALGLKPDDIEKVEKKLFIARFLDYFSEETFDFVYKDRSIDTYKNDIIKFISTMENGSEEDKLIKKNFDDNQIFNTISQLKGNAEKLAFKSGFKQAVDKRLRKLSLMVTFIMFGMMFVMLVLPIDLFIILPIICFFCMMPQILRGVVLKKWYEFKEQNKDEFYTANRDEILVLKRFTAEVLENIRLGLLDMKVPLQLIKFVLHSRDYDNLKLLNEKVIRSTKQYFFSFEYPPGMEPFPIPEILQAQHKPPFPEQKMLEKPEKNFIVLTEMKGKDGVITGFVPSLKESIADKINGILNDCEFSIAPKEFSEIIPKYSPDLGIFCMCGELAEIQHVQIVNWKKSFKFYLLEGKTCNCGEKIFALSLFDEGTQIPDDLKDIF